MHIQGQIPAVQSTAFYGISADPQSLQGRRTTQLRRIRATGKNEIALLGPAESPLLEAMQMIDQWTSDDESRQIASESDLI